VESLKDVVEGHGVMVLPRLDTAGVAGILGLGAHGLSPKGDVHWNLESEELITHALRREEGRLTAHGVFLAETGERTGRSPNDRFIVDESPFTDAVWWGDVNRPIERNNYLNIKNMVQDYLNSTSELFVEDLACGANPSLRLPIRVVTENAWHASFSRNMFLRITAEQIKETKPEFTILHAPNFKAPKGTAGINSDVFVIISFADGLVIIGGTRYAGEIKKSIFSIMNHILPTRGHLPMHCSANIGENLDSAVFFGLSGTGKTTLSADPRRPLIGDDEHGWSDEGIFNFEGGCYAKMIRLNEEDEPAIFETTRKPGSILENVILDAEGIPDFDDATLTENTRGSYPIEFIENRVDSSMGGHPKNVVFLTCDAFGVLPPIAKLNPHQAAYHFISGYTAKVAGTEMGVTEPKATFSACFGAPFMPMHPSIYGELLSVKIDEHDASCWMLNTGWIAGGFGKSDRIRIKWTRALLNAALDGSLNNQPMRKDERFGFEIPLECPGVPSEILDVRGTWKNPDDYDKAAESLVTLFQENFEMFSDDSGTSVINAGPISLVSDPDNS
jgi:phosphoenolpyruvate carboxykinase (ATP)